MDFVCLGSLWELQAREPWTTDGSALPVYRYEAWQNFCQYLLAHQSYHEELGQNWARIARARGIPGKQIEAVEVIEFRRRILAPGKASEPTQRLVTRLGPQPPS